MRIIHFLPLKVLLDQFIRTIHNLIFLNYLNCAMWMCTVYMHIHTSKNVWAYLGSILLYFGDVSFSFFLNTVPPISWPYPYPNHIWVSYMGRKRHDLNTTQHRVENWGGLSCPRVGQLQWHHDPMRFTEGTPLRILGSGHPRCSAPRRGIRPQLLRRGEKIPLQVWDFYPDMWWYL